MVGARGDTCADTAVSEQEQKKNLKEAEAV